MATSPASDTAAPATNGDTATVGHQASVAPRDAGSPRIAAPPRILTVCRGNVCRSPAAAAMIDAAADAAGLDLEVDSAGTMVATPGRRANRRMRRAAARAGIVVTSRTRQVRPEDLDTFDLVLAMDRSNLADLSALRADHGGRAEIRLYRSFDARARTTEVPDPFHAPASFHDSILATMAGALDGIVAWAATHDQRSTARAA